METTQWQMIVAFLHHAFLMSVSQWKHYFCLSCCLNTKSMHKYRFGAIVASWDADFLPPSGWFCDCVHLWAVTGLLFVFCVFSVYLCDEINSQQLLGGLTHLLKYNICNLSERNFQLGNKAAVFYFQQI